MARNFSSGYTNTLRLPTPFRIFYFASGLMQKTKKKNRSRGDFWIFFFFLSSSFASLSMSSKRLPNHLIPKVKYFFLPKDGLVKKFFFFKPRKMKSHFFSFFSAKLGKTLLSLTKLENCQPEEKKKNRLIS